MTDTDPTADLVTGHATALPDVVDSWLAGFCLSRGVPMRRVGQVVEVEVAGESRRQELVVVEPDQALVTATAMRLVGTTDVWMTVLTTVVRDYDLPPGVVVRDRDEVLMTLDLRGYEAHPTARVVVEPDGDRAFVSITIDDVVAANGQVAVVGADAVVDRVRTHDDHQRQGLGTEIMTALTAWAAERGATRAILAASVDGQALYRRLGWGVSGALLTLSAASPRLTGETPASVVKHYDRSRSFVEQAGPVRPSSPTSPVSPC